MGTTALPEMNPNTSISASSTPFPSTRSVPPPIDLGLAGSHIMRASNIQKERRNKAELVLGCHRYEYAVLDLRPPINIETETPSTSTFELESPSSSIWSNRADLKLVPNRRRRSCSVSGLTPPTSAKSVQSTSTTSSGFSDYSWPSHSLRTPSTSSSTSSFSALKTPNSATSSFSFNNNNSSASPNGKSCKKKTSLTSAFGGFGLKPRLNKETIQAVEEEENVECSRVFGVKDKDNSNMFVPFQGGLQDGINVNLPRKKNRRPGTSPLTPLSAMFTSEEGPGDGNKKKQRPSTASSTPTESLSSTQSSPPTPRRSSKLDWQWQWKRWSLLKSSNSNSNSTSMSASEPFPSPTSPRTKPSTTAAATKGNTTLSLSPPRSSAPSVQELESSATVSLHNSSSSKLLQVKNERRISRTHRSTPNLQVPPNLSMEDLGKINAFFAPPPTVRLQVLTKTTESRSQDSKLSTGVGEHIVPIPVPKVLIHTPTNQIEVYHQGLTKRKSNYGLEVNVNMNMREEKRLPIALPLSPISSEEWRAREDEGALFFTVEDDRDGGAVLRQVECPM